MCEYPMEVTCKFGYGEYTTKNIWDSSMMKETFRYYIIEEDDDKSISWILVSIFAAEFGGLLLIFILVYSLIRLKERHPILRFYNRFRKPPSSDLVSGYVYCTKKRVPNPQPLPKEVEEESVEKKKDDEVKQQQREDDNDDDDDDDAINDTNMYKSKRFM